MSDPKVANGGEELARQKARQELAESSWILEIRRKLADPPPLGLVPKEAPGAADRLAGPGGAGGHEAAAFALRRAAALVVLFVDAGQLWTVITLRTQRLAGHRSPPAFPGSLYGGPVVGEGAESTDSEGEDAESAQAAATASDPAGAWRAALAGGEREAGLYPQAALDLGRLDEVATPAGVIVTPCVAAIPEPALRKREEPAEDAGVDDVVPMPLTVLARPQLVERRPVMVAGEESEILILHVGRHRIWGVTASIVVNLLDRLGMASLGAEAG